MSIHKRLVERVEHVWIQDYALNKEDPARFAEAWAKFKKGGSVADLPCKPGKTPAVFTLKPISRRVYNRLDSIQGENKRIEHVVAHGLVGAVNFDAGGLVPVFEATGSGDERRLSEDTLDTIFDPSLFGDLFVRIMEISKIDPTHGQD